MSFKDFTQKRRRQRVHRERPRGKQLKTYLKWETTGIYFKIIFQHLRFQKKEGPLHWFCEISWHFWKKSPKREKVRYNRQKPEKLGKSFLSLKARPRSIEAFKLFRVSTPEIIIKAAIKLETVRVLRSSVNRWALCPGFLDSWGEMSGKAIAWGLNKRAGIH